MQPEIKCKDYHIWIVSEEGQICQCGKMIFHMEKCNCPGKENEMEFKPHPNPNYKGEAN